MGRFHLLSWKITQSELCFASRRMVEPAADENIDTTGTYAIQGDSKKTNRVKETCAVLESGAAYWCPSASTRCLCAYPCRIGGGPITCIETMERSRIVDGRLEARSTPLVQWPLSIFRICRYGSQGKVSRSIYMSCSHHIPAHAIDAIRYTLPCPPAISTSHHKGFHSRITTRFRRREWRIFRPGKGSHSLQKSPLTFPLKVLHLLDRLSTTVTQPFFLQNLWLSMLTTQSARAPALNYLARRLPKLSGDEGMNESPSKPPYLTHS